MRTTSSVTTRRTSQAAPVAVQTRPPPVEVEHNEADRGTTSTALEARAERVRQAAYALYEQRGCGDGHDFDDWLMAETLVDRELAGSHGEDAPADRPE